MRAPCSSATPRTSTADQTAGLDAQARALKADGCGVLTALVGTSGIDTSDRSRP